MTKRGRLIVFEGADGSGKTTQSKLLVNYLNNPPAGGKIPNAYVSFPRYEDSMWGQMVKRYLMGEFGKLDEVDPYFGSLPYAGDRMTAADELKRWLNDGKIVVANRYIGSNIGHMAAKFSDIKSQDKYIKWLEDLEYRENGIPKEDLVLFLHVPVEVSKKLMRGRHLDIHERDLRYLEKVIRVYERVASERKNWETIACTSGGKILPAAEIHQRVLEVLKRCGILRIKK